MRKSYADDFAALDKVASGSGNPIAAIETWSPEKLLTIQTQLKRQPTAWYQDFLKAVLGARERNIKALINQLPSEQQDLADLLNHCVSQLRFDVLTQLVQPLNT